MTQQGNGWTDMRESAKNNCEAAAAVPNRLIHFLHLTVEYTYVVYDIVHTPPISIYCKTSLRIRTLRIAKQWQELTDAQGTHRYRLLRTYVV